MPSWLTVDATVTAASGGLRHIAGNAAPRCRGRGRSPGRSGTGSVTTIPAAIAQQSTRAATAQRAPAQPATTAARAGPTMPARL
jgi:hypothetical protein